MSTNVLYFGFFLAALLGLGLTLVSPGLFVVDELIYVWAAENFASTRSLLIPFGTDLLGLDQISLNFLVEQTDGMAPQYPIGLAVLGGLIFPYFGIYGLIVINTLSTAVSTILVGQLAILMFREQRVALLSMTAFALFSFNLDHAYAVWPHAICVTFILCAYVLAFKAIGAEDQPSTRRPFVFAGLAGLCIGLGFLFRVDTLLALGPLFFLAVIFSRAPVRTLGSGLLGMAPGLLTASLSAKFKFGTFNPLSYGRTVEGGADLETYFPLALAGIGLTVLAITMRVLGDQKKRLLVLLALAAVVGVAVLANDRMGQVGSFLKSAQILIADIREIPTDDRGLHQHSDGYVLIAKNSKKALGQSMPWIGLLLIIVVAPWPKHRRLEYTFLVLAFGIFMTPFIITTWYGGLGSNMRYFLPVLPLIAILGSRVFFDYFDASWIRDRGLFIAFLLGVAGWLFWRATMPSGIMGVRQSVAYWILVAVSTSVVIGALPVIKKSVSASIVCVVSSFAFAFGMMQGFDDLTVSQAFREAFLLKLQSSEIETKRLTPDTIAEIRKIQLGTSKE